MSLDAVGNSVTNSEQSLAYTSFLNEVMTPSAVGANTTLDSLKSTYDKVPASFPKFSVGNTSVADPLVDVPPVRDTSWNNTSARELLQSIEALTPATEYEKQVYNAGSAAYDKFPTLQEIGASRELIGKVGLYEYRNRSSYGTDWAQDWLLSLPENRVPSGTYGPFQISKHAFFEAKRQYPDQLAGYNLADLNTPEKAAVICGAFLATRAEEFKRGNFRGIDTVAHFYQCGDRNRALVLSYNPGEGKFRGGGNYDGRQRSNDCLAQTL